MEKYMFYSFKILDIEFMNFDIDSEKCILVVFF